MRLRRCELSTPASNERMIEKAAGSLADLVFLDLEDSVAPNEKVASRAKVIHLCLLCGNGTHSCIVSWIEAVAQRVAQQVQANHNQYNCKSGAKHHPGIGIEIDLGIANHRSPFGSWRLDT